MKARLWQGVVVGMMMAGTVVIAGPSGIMLDVGAPRFNPEKRMRFRQFAEARGRAAETEAAALQRRQPQRLGQAAADRGPRRMHDAAMLPRLLHHPRFAEQIGLNEDQAAALSERLTDYAREMQALREQLQAKAAEQAALLEADPIDEAAVMAVVEELGAIQTQVNRLRVGEVIFMRQTLTDEQLERAAEIMPMRLRRLRERNVRRRIMPDAEDDTD